MSAGEHAGTTGMPLYRSHKIVRGAPVVERQVDDNIVAVCLPDGSTLDVDVPPDLFDRIKGPDGYLVEYEDGYLSWSPSEAFESGYTRVDEGADAA